MIRRIFTFMLVCFSLMALSCEESVDSEIEISEALVLEDSIQMLEILNLINVDSLNTECDCVDALLRVTDLMLEVPEKRKVDFNLEAISADSIASFEMKSGHRVFQKIISRCVHGIGVTQEVLATCPNYKQAEANTEKLKTLKLK